METNNISSLFFKKVQRHPEKLAFVIPHNIYDEDKYFEEKITFKEFENIVNEFRNGLINNKYRKGDRIIILAPIDEQIYALMLAMFSLGLVAVFLDPGIGIKKILTAISDSKSKAIVSLDRLLKYHTLVPHLWRMKKYSVDKKRMGVHLIETLKCTFDNTLKVTPLSDDDHALITFTSGSTGRSKGSDRNVKNIKGQIDFIKNNWNCTEDTIDFPSFPMFGFMNLLLGITTIVPAIDFAKINDFNPKVVAAQMIRWKVTRSCGSYAFNNKLSLYLEENNLKIETLKNIALGGCPVNKEFCLRLNNVYPNVKAEIIYGSTEVAPISSLLVEEYLNSQTTQGFPVGKAYENVEVKIVNLPKVIESFENIEHEIGPYELEKNKIGEIIIRSAHTVQKYVDNPKATRENKIKSPSGLSWHRTGDTGFIDDNGHIHLVGRLGDTVKISNEIIHPFMVETKIDELNEIQRSALVQIKSKAVLYLQLKYDLTEEQLRNRLSQVIPSNLLNQIKLKIIQEIPVDDRHKSKINRVLLRRLNV